MMAMITAESVNHEDHRRKMRGLNTSAAYRFDENGISKPGDTEQKDFQEQ